jgi:ferrous iron transport protein B
MRRIALAGNPNAGKTTLFNALTGMRQKVGNYPGVTVEKKEGRCQLPDGTEAVILDLPGTYSLSPKSPDEEIARDVLLGLRPDTPVPDAVIVVVDASNLERNLFLATQILELGIPTVVALNMCDVANAAGKAADVAQLSEELGAPVVELVAVRGQGITQLQRLLADGLPRPRPPRLQLPASIEDARSQLSAAIDPGRGDNADPTVTAGPRGTALRLLCSNVPLAAVREQYGPIVADMLDDVRADGALKPSAAGAAEVQARYAVLGDAVQRVVQHSGRELPQSFTDRADSILTHKFWGLVIFAAITLLVFSAIFAWAQYPMDFINNGVSWLGDKAATALPAGPLQELIVKGVIAGVGAVVVFLPQILILFFFIGLLEDSGYMARAAFMMDRLMSRVGLHGRAFIPLMSSFACAIPGIMATRTIASRRDRMTTILIAPLMSCSARLPVYTLMIATFIPAGKLFSVPLPIPGVGVWHLGPERRAVVMFALYAGGVLAAMGAAWLFKRTLFKGPPPALMLELPPYKIPAWRNVVVTMWERGFQFLQRAGTVILAISIVLWFMLSYPRVDAKSLHGSSDAPGAPAAALTKDEAASLQLRHSFAGYIGRAVEPLIAPLGFNWKIGIGLIGAMSAREVFVSTMGTVYSVGEADETSEPLQSAMKKDTWPNGKPVWTTLTAVSLLAYFVLAMQCMSTLAVVRRETNSWKWPLFMQCYMTALAWIVSFMIYQGGHIFGLG